MEALKVHLKNILADSVLDRNSVVKEFLTTAKDNKKRKVIHYNSNKYHYNFLKRPKI